MTGNVIHVLYEIALGECVVRYWPVGVWCTILRWRNVMYDTALEECGVRCCYEGNAVYAITSRRHCRSTTHSQARYVTLACSCYLWQIDKFVIDKLMI